MQIKSYTDVQNLLENNAIVLILASTENCSVCTAVAPRIETIAAKHTLVVHTVKIEKVPMFAGQAGVFTAPTLLLYHRGREYHRQSRFIDFQALDQRIKELIDFEASHINGPEYM